MTNEPLPYGTQHIDGDDVRAVVDTLRGDWLTTGPAVDAFERRLAEYCGAKEAVAVNSGTAALHAAYRGAGVGPDTEVIVPSLTFCATASAAVHLGAEVRFADIDEQTLTMDPDSVEDLRSERTAAVVPVDFAGHSADLDRIGDAAGDAVVVRDAAHSLGGAYRGAPIGSLADLTVFSFHPVKAITTGEGGAVVTDDAEYAKAMRRFRDHGRRPAGASAPPWAYDVDDVGYNYRISDMQCALGLSQLGKLDDFIARRQKVAARYRRRLDGIDGVELPPHKPWCDHAYHLFVARVDPRRRAGIFDGLRSRNIGVQVHYVPVNMLTAFRRRGHRPEQTPAALRNYRRMISLPCFPAMDSSDVDRVADALIELVEEKK